MSVQNVQKTGILLSPEMAMGEIPSHYLEMDLHQTAKTTADVFYRLILTLQRMAEDLKEDPLKIVASLEVMDFFASTFFQRPVFHIRDDCCLSFEINPNRVAVLSVLNFKIAEGPQNHPGLNPSWLPGIWEIKACAGRENIFNRLSKREIKHTEPPKESVLQIKKKYQDLFAHYIQMKGDKFLEELIKPGSPLIEQMMLKLYEAGCGGALFRYKHFLQNKCLEVEPFVQKWKKKIEEDFEKGESIAIPAMVDLINHTDRNASEDVVQKNLATLIELAEQGSSEAERAISFCYEWNQLNNIPLKLSFEERLNGLEHLAKLGSPSAQNTLGHVYYHNNMGHDACNFTKEERQNYLLGLLEIESCHNFYVTQIFSDSGDLDFPYTSEQKIEKLFDRAKRGDNEAFKCLWTLLEDGEYAKRLNLSNKQRLKQIYALKDINPSLFNEHAVDCFEFNTFDNIRLNMGIKQRLLWLESQGLKEKNHKAGSALTSIYKENSFGSGESLDLSFEERCQKLHELALSGYSDAADILRLYYQGKFSPDFKDAEDIMDQDTMASKLDELTYVGRHFPFSQSYYATSVRDQLIALYTMLTNLSPL